jgi:predicted O-methyltransferase YrrM
VLYRGVMNFFKKLRAKILASYSNAVVHARLSVTKREEFEKSQADAFLSLGLDLRVARTRCTEVFSISNLKRADSSMHYELFASIASIASLGSVLEIGTSSGNFTQFLSKLLPNSKIHTWDLPPRSFKESRIAAYQSIKSGYGDQTLVSKLKLDELSNVHQVRRDSTYLALENGKFDAIWVDGDHAFPVVAFDIINAIRMIKLGGWICVDDIRPSGPGGGLGAQETFSTVNHLESIGLVSLRLIAKRLNPESMVLKPEKRKYIAVLRRLV